MESKIYWFTGQPGSGKTVLSLKLKTFLEFNTINEVFHIDGDELRKLFNNQKYGREGREENIKRAQDIAKFILSQGHSVVVSLVAPYKEIRESFKKELGNSLVEFYVHTTDIRGREHFHTDEYEKPTENYVDVDTTNVEIQISLNQIIENILI
jgi:adenylylsulfate kinase-like enzyme